MPAAFAYVRLVSPEFARWAPVLGRQWGSCHNVGVDDATDPGWGSVSELAATAVRPDLSFRGLPNVLAATRSTVALYSVGYAVIGLMAFAIVALNEIDGASRGVASLVVAAIGAVLVGASWFADGTLPCESPAALAAGYFKRFMMRLTLVSAVALIGFVATILSSSVLPYFVGVLCAAVGLALNAPTRWRLDRDQSALNASGCTLNLIATLKLPPELQR